jgi:CBS domain containing-hemolysin-like protein/mannitol/fructose-specific phosphotransferase system IIA component
MIAIWISILILLLVINAWFVLAEFSIVRVRPSRIEELRQQGDTRADLVADIQRRLDEYLGVCQVGITVASVALGMVGKQLTDAIMQPGQGGEESLLTNVIAIVISLVVVSGSHIVLGEQVPKYAAVRIADRMALWTARPLRLCRMAFLPLLWVMNTIALACLRLLGIPGKVSSEHHSEEELRILLEHGQEHGLLSFRRLLFMENVFDLGDLKVKQAMRPRAQIVVLTLDTPWHQTVQAMRQGRYSRFPVIGDDPNHPLGVIHVKDLLLVPPTDSPALPAFIRPCLTTQDTTPLESLLAEMQRRRMHIAMVFNAEGRWTGLITMEDIIEEIIGTVGDEFEMETPLQLGEVLTPGRIVLDVEAANMAEATRLIINRVPASELPMPAADLVLAVFAKERFAPTYLGRGIALPHARLQCLTQPVLIFARSPHGVPLEKGERARVLFLLLTPADQPRVHQKLQARLARLLESSDYVEEKLRDATTAAEILDVIRTGEQASLD